MYKSLFESTRGMVTKNQTPAKMLCATTRLPGDWSHVVSVWEKALLPAIDPFAMAF